MSQTLDEFLEEECQKLIKFEEWWRKQHAVNPEHFPMEMKNGNEGMWFESLSEFDPAWADEPVERIQEPSGG